MSAERVESQVQDNTSGQGKGLNWVWDIFNKTTIALLMLILFVNPVMAQETEKALKPDAKLAMKGVSGLAAIWAGAGRGEAAAIRKLKVLAAKGNAEAQVLLGDLYLTGKGVFKNGSLAGTWYQRAAEKGNALGQYKIAIIYLNGVYLPLDPKEAGKWLKKAAQQGHASARETLVIRLGETPPPIMKPKK